MLLLPHSASAARCARLRRVTTVASGSRSSNGGPPSPGAAAHPAAVALALAALVLAQPLASWAASGVADAATPFAERCATEQCRQLLSAPTEPRKPLTPEEKRLRRLAAIDLEAAQAKAAAVDRALRARLAPAYDAKSAAELAEGRQALTEGATKAEARARAARAGELAFAAATADVGALEREQAAYEQRLAQRRLEAARAGGPGPG